jgi:hypothetical protein
VRAPVRVSDVQRFGLLSAAAVVARYAEVVDRTISGGDAQGPVDADGLVDGAARLTRAALRLLDAGAALVERTQLGAAPVRPERVEPPPTVPGSWTEAPVWVHNPTATAAQVALHATTLVSATGAMLPAAAVECSDSTPKVVAPLGSCEVRVRVAVPTGQSPGRYHGLLVGSVAPEPMPLLVVVELTSEGEDAR